MSARAKQLESIVIPSGSEKAKPFPFAVDFAPPANGLVSTEFTPGFLPVVEEPVIVLDPPLYHAMPALIVSANYQGRLRYLQVKLSVMTRDSETLNELDVNTPLIQDALIMLLNEYPFDRLETPEGKEDFRKRALVRVQEVIADEKVESLLFTGFVIQ